MRFFYECQSGDGQWEKHRKQNATRKYCFVNVNEGQEKIKILIEDGESMDLSLVSL